MRVTIPKAENQYIELKSARVQGHDLAEEIIAFANAEGGKV